MFEKLAEIETRFQEVEKLLSDPSVVSDRDRFTKLSREHSELEPLMGAWAILRKTREEMASHKELLEEESDEDLRELVKAELPELEARAEELEAEIKVMLLPKDPNDDKNVILEVRAGTGGDEATLFAADLYRMYTRYAELRGWKVEVLSMSESEVGGFKEVIALIKGAGAYSRLKFEAGTHRVQRVPKTEAQGRIHTSACTVAVLPEAEDVEVNIDPNDLRIDVYRSSGPGGQSVNTTDSAVRVTHVPTGLVVSCQDEKSQHKNKAKALKILSSRLLEKMQDEQDEAIAGQRRKMVGSGDRSERIRTYNFPQERLTDHRINLTLYKLTQVLEGNLDEVIDPLIAHYRAEMLKAEEGSAAAAS
ncbi:MAG: peptide chain release factor 1 [Chrysiogenetes bacterium]|nr:peptide chain release factor 1 [Chrysiogenetes bacterium]